MEFLQLEGDVNTKKLNFKAKVKTKDDTLVYPTVQARDEFSALYKIQRRYPHSSILSLQNVKGHKKDK